MITDYLRRLAIYAVLIGLVVLLTYLLFKSRAEITDVKERHEGNMLALTAELEKTRLHDSLSTASAAALELRAGEAERVLSDLRRHVKDLGVRMRDVQSATTAETVTRDTVWLTLPAAGGDGGAATADTCADYSDGWLTASLCLGADSSAALVYAVRDSVATIVHVRYRKRFLWFRWRPEYRATVTSFNPRTEVISAEAVVIKE